MIVHIVIGKKSGTMFHLLTVLNIIINCWKYEAEWPASLLEL